MSDLIDVWDIETFDSSLIDVLQQSADLIVDYFKSEHYILVSHDLDNSPDRPVMRPSNLYAGAYYALLDTVSSMMSQRLIRGFHYTRMTDEEVAELLRTGIHLSTPETLRLRLDGLVASGNLTADIANQLYSKSPFHGTQRAARCGKFWMVSHPVRVDNGGVVPLLEHWGGEVASFWNNDAIHLELLAKLGKGRILEIAAPLNITCSAHSASTAVIAAFGRSRGATPEKSAFDFYVTAPLTPAAVRAVHTDDEETFVNMGKTYPARYVDIDIARQKEISGLDA
ncbi:MAG: hypothetical protein ACOYO0_02695 [Sandarakinorhabdus sp.]